MKVHELMEALKQFPGDMLVLTDGYETGYDEICRPKTLDVVHEPQKPSYDGEYQDTEGKFDNSITVVVLGRTRRAD